jgi:hypothetical protein
VSDVWVVVQSFGCEGLGVPQAAFLTEEEAQRFVRSKSLSETWCVEQVPVFRFFPNGASDTLTEGERE